MAQKNKALIVVGSLVVIGSIGYYLYSKSKATSKGGSSEEPTPNDVPTPTPTPTPNPTPTPTPNVGVPNISDYLKSFKEIQEFQDWLDGKYPTWLKGGKLAGGSGYGNAGTNTKKAWVKYGAEYVKFLTQKKQGTANKLKIDEVKTAFPRGKFVLAKITFRAFAQELRNGVYYPTDSVGNQLPSKEFKANSSVGKVMLVLNDGMVIVQTGKPLRSNLSNKDFYLIKVNPNWIK